MRICITRSKKNPYSETFIRDQITWFKQWADVYTIHTGRLPERKEDGSLIGSKLIWGLHKAVKLFVGRNNIFSSYALKKYLKENKIDVVLANYGMPGSHMAPICKSLGIPLISIFHGHDATDQKLLKQYRKKYQNLFDYADYTIAVSEVMRQKLLALGAYPEKLKLIPYGVDVSKFKPREEKPNSKTFLAVGRFTEKKGPSYTIRAFHKTLQKFPEAKLVMVGGKTGLFQECEQLVNRLGISEAVNFTGVKSPEEIAELMSTSLAFVQHSITASNGDMEGTPLAILEAGASAMPIVSTRHGGIIEAIVHEKTGFLVDEKDENSMAEFMMKLLEDPDQAKKMGQMGRKHIIENYFQEKQVRKIYELAKLALDHHSTP